MDIIVADVESGLKRNGRVVLPVQRDSYDGATIECIPVKNVELALIDRGYNVVHSDDGLIVTRPTKQMDRLVADVEKRLQTEAMVTLDTTMDDSIEDTDVSYHRFIEEVERRGFRVDVLESCPVVLEITRLETVESIVADVEKQLAKNGKAEIAVASLREAGVADTFESECAKRGWKMKYIDFDLGVEITSDTNTPKPKPETIFADVEKRIARDGVARVPIASNSPAFQSECAKRGWRVEFIPPTMEITLDVPADSNEFAKFLVRRLGHEHDPFVRWLKLKMVSVASTARSIEIRRVVSAGNNDGAYEFDGERFECPEISEELVCTFFPKPFTVDWRCTRIKISW
jgi:hypothetical protein